MGMGGVMLIGYAFKALRDEARLHAASTPTVEAVLAAEYGHDVAEFNGALHVPRNEDCSEGLWWFYPGDATWRRTSSLRSFRWSKKGLYEAGSKPCYMGGDSLLPNWKITLDR